MSKSQRKKNREKIVPILKSNTEAGERARQALAAHVVESVLAVTEGDPSAAMLILSYSLGVMIGGVMLASHGTGADDEKIAKGLTNWMGVVRKVAENIGYDTNMRAHAEIQAEDLV